ncbi:helix-turn-helix domain-containing protein [Deinococcus gobiensis]|uniref:Transposase, putative n=1 Tax=Deinococcus gobiensis (strain DSM 21396 / JCM 16679 / CGMCC 1.7299 / I-0) TaxID=745776 RepID=H8H259_DEIGI|nr:helix-turn-helix domain-containing protein [Deinococcus gobiensis]AFD27606.1 Transposase, putative [Deinococcus gobiensis I-0]
MKYAVHLTPEERAHLKALLKSGTAPTRKLTHARILLKADLKTHGLDDEHIAETLEVHPRTVQRVRKTYVLEGFEAALNHLRPQRLKPKKLDERGEAHLVALACSTVPEELGHRTWTLRLLADQMMELGYVDSISYETVRVYLKKTFLNPINTSSSSFRPIRTVPLSRRWRMYWTCTRHRTNPYSRSSVLTSDPVTLLPMSKSVSRTHLVA